MQKDEKARVKRLLRQTLPDLFGLDREELSEDEEMTESMPACASG